MSELQNDSTTDLLRTWFLDMNKEKYIYREPQLDEATVKIIRRLCSSFKQDIHVFINAIEILEEYLRIKTVNKTEVKNELLIAIVAIFVSYKFTGNCNDLKLKYVQSAWQKLTGATGKISPQTVKAAEIDILNTLGTKISISTPIDDVNTLAELYVREFGLRVNVRKLCVHILELIYCKRTQWFQELKSIYNQNQDSLLVFQYLMTNKLYLPVVILYTAFRVTNYKNVLDVSFILREMVNFSKIHSDHIEVLSDKVVKMID